MDESEGISFGVVRIRAFDEEMCRQSAPCQPRRIIRTCEIIVVVVIEVASTYPLLHNELNGLQIYYIL